jgi:hypothetical protein
MTEKLTIADVATFFKALRDATSADEAHDLLVSDQAEEIEEAITALAEGTHDYTWEHMDAAACAWEHVLERLNERRKGEKGEPNPWEEYRKAYGMAALRDTVVGHAKTIDEEYQKAVANGYGDSFDWDFVPKYMEDHVTRILT